MSSAKLCVITAYFNPSGNPFRLKAFKQFIKALRNQNVNLIVVEGHFGCPSLTGSGIPKIQVCLRDLIWMKERLLNIALCEVPDRCTAVAWLDGDVAFENDSWPAKTLEALERFAVVQPFSKIIRLGPDGQPHHNPVESFAYVNSGCRYAYREGIRAIHGHTGFAWAARLDLLKKHKFFDLCITGTGDHLMAHAFCGDRYSSCVASRTKMRSPLWYSFQQWAEAFACDSQGQIGYVDGMIRHFWHGPMPARDYDSFTREFLQISFDPKLDLVTDSSGSWVWNRKNHALHDWSANMFEKREHPST